MVPELEKDVRKNPRTPVSAQCDVDGETLLRGALLRDMSVAGAAVTFPEDKAPAVGAVRISDEVVLIVKGRAHIPGRVVRLFDGGFAVQFDWSIDVDRNSRLTVAL